MNPAAAIHESLMNRSRTILPRVGGGVGVGGRGGSVPLHSAYLTVARAPKRPAVPDRACKGGFTGGLR